MQIDLQVQSDYFLPSLIDFLNHITHECDYIIKDSDGKTQEEIVNDETLSREF